jgi:uncharacterized membrane protein
VGSTPTARTTISGIPPQRICDDRRLRIEGDNMPDKAQPVPTPVVDWIAAAILGSYTELLAAVLRKFGTDMRDPMVHWSLQAVLLVTLMTAMIIVPIFLMSRASEKLVDRRTERIIFILSLLGSAFFMPPLSWFAHLASGLPPLQ